MIRNVVARHTKKADGRPYMESLGLNKTKAMNDEAAMLYAIDAKSNKSKYYEMLIIENDSGSATLLRRWGRLGDKFQTKNEEFSDLDTAKRALMKIKSSKMRGSSKYRDAFDSRMHKTPDGKQLPKGQYPIGLSSNAGPWQNQSIQTCKPALGKLLAKINEAVEDALNQDMSAVTNDLYIADRLVSELGTSSMAKEVRRKIKAPLARLTGTGRHKIDPAKTVKELKTLSRYLSKQMSMCMTASVADRSASEPQKAASTKTASSYEDLKMILGKDQFRTLALLRRNLHGASTMSTETANLLMDVIKEMGERVQLDRNTKTALNKMRNLDDKMNADMARNQIFKIADLLGMKLPSAMFASDKKERSDV